MSEQDLLRENRFLRQKLMQLQNLFLQLVIACCNQPSNINNLFSNINAVLNEAVQPAPAPASAAPVALGGGNGGSSPGHGEVQGPLPPTPTAQANNPLDHQVSGFQDHGLLPVTGALPNGQLQAVSVGGRPVVQLCLETAHQALNVMCDAPQPIEAGVGLQPATGGSGDVIKSEDYRGASGGVNDLTLADVPPKPFLDYLCTIDEIWREYKYGDRVSKRPAISELDAKYGDRWRKKEYVRDSKELKSRQNLYNKRKCVWLEVQHFQNTQGLSEAQAVTTLQKEVNEFSKGLSRFIDTVLRERQKGRRVDCVPLTTASGEGDAGEPSGRSRRADSGSKEDEGGTSRPEKRQRVYTRQPHQLPALLPAPPPLLGGMEQSTLGSGAYALDEGDAGGGPGSGSMDDTAAALAALATQQQQHAAQQQLLAQLAQQQTAMGLSYNMSTLLQPSQHHEAGPQGTSVSQSLGMLSAQELGLGRMAAQSQVELEAALAMQGLQPPQHSHGGERGGGEGNWPAATRTQGGEPQ